MQLLGLRVGASRHLVWLNIEKIISITGDSLSESCVVETPSAEYSANVPLDKMVAYLDYMLCSPDVKAATTKSIERLCRGYLGGK